MMGTRGFAPCTYTSKKFLQKNLEVLSARPLLKQCLGTFLKYRSTRQKGDILWLVQNLKGVSAKARLK